MLQAVINDDGTPIDGVDELVMMMMRVMIKWYCCFSRESRENVRRSTQNEDYDIVIVVRDNRWIER
jgi:hypothetical protein